MSLKNILSIATLFLVLTTSAIAASREVVHRTNPVYPEIAKRTNLQGVVTLKVSVGSDGKVKSVSAVTGNAILSQAAITAVKQWVYVPGTEESFNVDLTFTTGQ